MFAFRFCIQAWIVFYTNSMIEKEKAYQADDLKLISALETQSNPPRPTHLLARDLQVDIMRIITQQEEREIINQPYLQLATKDLEMLLDDLQTSARNSQSQELLQTRMHQLAVAKVLVFTHGKSDFRLVTAHFALGRAYLENKCYEQAVSHLTIASTKVSKMGDIKETKIYNSYILTALARCYLGLQGYNHCLQLLTRAYDIQSNNQNIKGSSLAQQTLQLLVRVYLKIKMPKDAIRIIDKLIDILKNQFWDFDAILKKLAEIAQKYTIFQPQSSKSANSRIEALRKKGAEYLELIKPFEALTEKLQFLIIEHDRKALRQLLPQILREVQIVMRVPNTYQQVYFYVQGITRALVDQLKAMMIFKFKIYLESDGEYLTDSIDQQLKKFLREYYEEAGDNPIKIFTSLELIEVYKLLVHYCMRFSDHDTQLQYLKSLQDMFVSRPMPEGSLELLKVKRNIAMIFNQKRMLSQAKDVLKQIKALQRELFGKNSQAVKKTSNMIRIFDQENKSSSYFCSTGKQEKSVSITKKLIN